MSTRLVYFCGAINPPKVQAHYSFYRFLLEILQASLEKYMAPESSGDIFLLPIDFDFDLCKVRRPLEPLIKSLYSLINLFSSREKGNQMLSGRFGYPILIWFGFNCKIIF